MQRPQPVNHSYLCSNVCTYLPLLMLAVCMCSNSSWAT